MVPGRGTPGRSPLARFDEEAPPVAINVSDTLLAKLVDASAITALLARSDTLLPKTSEGTTAVAVSLSRTDTVLPKLADTLAIFAVLARSDTVLPRLDDALAIKALLSRSDAVLPRLNEGSAQLLAGLSRSDTLLPKIAEGTIGLFSALSRADVLAPKLVEGAHGHGAPGRFSPGRSPLARIEGESPPLQILAFLSRADAATIAGALDAIADLFARLALADALQLALLDIERIAYPAPLERTIMVRKDGRIILVPKEWREKAVEGEDRAILVRRDNRTTQ